MKRLLIFLALTACAWSQPTMPFANWKSAAVSSWTPASDDSTALWLRADAVTGKSAGDTTYIWPAYIGQNAYQLTAASKFRWYPDSLNGMPALTADGVDDIMSVASVTLGGPNLTLCVVARRAVPVGEKVIVELSTNNNAVFGGFLYASTPDSGRQYMASGPTPGYNRANTRAITGAAPYYFIASSRRGFAFDLQTRVELNADSAQYMTLNSVQQTGGYTSYPLFIGARSGIVVPGRLTIAEIIIIRRFDYATLANLRQYVQTRYGL